MARQKSALRVHNEYDTRERKQGRPQQGVINIRNPPFLSTVSMMHHGTEASTLETHRFFGH